MSLPSGGATPNFGRTPAGQSSRSNYVAYKSPFAPKYSYAKHFHGITAKTVMHYGSLLGGFGAVAGVFALFFFAEVPKVRQDIFSRTPIGPYLHKEIAPEDNPF